MTVTIRKATAADAPALSRICLLTCVAGKSGEGLYDYPELPGLVFAVPYVTLPTTFGYVLVDDRDDQDRREDVVGYILGCTDTRKFEKIATESWWHVQRAKFPSVEEMEKSGKGQEGDKHYIKLLDDMFTAPDANIEFSPAHLHIDILETHQRQGWGRKLIGRLVEHMQEEGLDGVWLGLDPKNQDARRFYRRLGFKEINGEEDNNMGLKFDQWTV
jgi:ribosomal protein S18 acetylase RimI-like enzyme